MGGVPRRWADFGQEIEERGIVIDDIAPARISPFLSGIESQDVAPATPESNAAQASDDFE